MMYLPFFMYIFLNFHFLLVLLKKSLENLETFVEKEVSFLLLMLFLVWFVFSIMHAFISLPIYCLCIFKCSKRLDHEYTSSCSYEYFMAASNNLKFPFYCNLNGLKCESGYVWSNYAHLTSWMNWKAEIIAIQN